MSIDSEEDLEAFVQPPEIEEFDVPEALAFAPWHKPRKQYVRTRQWMNHIGGILATLRDVGHFQDERPFRYLTLPGPDLLDVRMVADVCGSNNVKLSYLGFCHVDEAEGRRLRRNVTEFAVTRSDAVLSSSRVVPARLQDVKHNNTEAFVAMSRNGTYDAVNIDACDPIANDNIDNTGRLIDSIRRITEYQISNRREPWVLFLTTPIQTDSISAGSLQAIQNQVLQNVKQDQEFAGEISKRYQEGEALSEFMARSCAQNGNELLSLVCLGLGKWLIHISEQVNFRVKVMTPYCYSIFQEEPYEPNMISLCFLFEPTQPPIQDETGLTENPVAPEISTVGISDHIRALRKSAKIENLDVTLANDDGLRAEMIEQTKSLLRDAGYAVDNAVSGYEAWLGEF